MEYEKLFDVAKRHIQKLKVGTVFSVKELFSGTDWNKLSRGDKLGFGRFFKKSIAILGNVEYQGKAENNSSLYKKIK